MLTLAMMTATDWILVLLVIILVVLFLSYGRRW